LLPGRITPASQLEVAMKSDNHFRQDVIRELEWDPQVSDADAIGVAAKGGAVTLTGFTTTYAEKLAAVRAAGRVYGVKAVADELRVRLTAGPARDDADIAWAIAHVLEWSTQIPAGQVLAEVRGGWVVLDGTVEWDYQRHEVERMVRHVRGVTGITNDILVSPPTSPDEIQDMIEEAFKREAEVDARHISVEVSDHTARLSGHVHSLSEASAAAAAAAAAPGVADVESHLVVSP
jgi:osmotically-inducible protein OsmY